MKNNGIYRLIRKPILASYIFHRRLFDSYRAYEKKKGKIKKESNNGNILITIINGAYGHLFEGLFARKASLHGYNVSVLCCGGFLDYCEGIQEIAKNKKIICALCLAQQEEFVKAFGTDAYTYNGLISSKDEDVIEAYIKDYFNTPEKKHLFLDTQIDQILRSALQRYYLVAEPNTSDIKVVKGFLRTILITIISMDRLVSKLHPKYVMSSHGTYSTWGAVVEYCKSHGVYVITYGQNYNKCGMEFTYDDSYLTGDLNDKENKWSFKELSENELLRAKRFLDMRSGNLHSEKVAFDYNKDNKTRYSREQICEALNFSESKKIIGMFPNIPWDGQVTGGSVVFPRFIDWLKATIDFFAERDDAVLVIRSHPAERNVGAEAGRETTTSLLNSIYRKLPENVIILPPNSKINSYTLGENSDFGITYSSTVTLELIHMGVPVILCGCPPFKGKGIAFDISSEENYHELLNKGLEGNLYVDESRKTLLYKYIHYFFFMRTMPQSLVEIKDTVPIKYLFKDEKQLDEDPVFANMFRCIDNKLPMDFSEFYD